MSSNHTGSDGQAAVRLGNGNGPAAPTSPFAEVGQQQLFDHVPAGLPTVLDSATTAVARVQEEIDVLWRDSMTVDNDAVSERLVEVSHALQRAARLLEEDRAIG